jgi:hypothetical protein
MKNILKNYVYLSLFLSISLVISSCTDDDTGGSDAAKVIPLISSLDGETLAFQGDVLSYSIQRQRGGSEYIWTVTGAEMQAIEGTTAEINVLFNQFALPVTISVYELAFNGKSSDPVTINVTVFGPPCDWTLETSDTYGDGWNGGYVEVSFGGITTQYREDDGVPTVFAIGVPDGADFSFTYVSGGGTGGGPGWESENYFKLTAPDGTVYEEGSMDYSGIPTPGVIVSGTNACP